MADGVQEVKCPGHNGKCTFCKRTEGYERSVNGMPEMQRSPTNPREWIQKVDPCCKACANNMRHDARFYNKTSIS